MAHFVAAAGTAQGKLRVAAVQCLPRKRLRYQRRWHVMLVGRQLRGTVLEGHGLSTPDRPQRPSRTDVSGNCVWPRCLASLDARHGRFNGSAQQLGELF
jgi:hypothetical protein